LDIDDDKETRDSKLKADRHRGEDPRNSVRLLDGESKSHEIERDHAIGNASSLLTGNGHAGINPFG